MTEERNLLDYAYVLVKWRRLIVVAVLCVSLAAAGVSLLLPKRWTASTTLLPPEEESGQLGLSSMLMGGNVPPNLGKLVGGSAPSERLLTFLGSKRVLGAMVDRFGLVEAYGAPNRELAIDYLDEDVEREVDQEGTLRIDVTASSPDTAAAIAAALVEELDAVNRYYKSLQASMLRQFLEERMQVVQRELEASGKDLQSFQETYGLVDIEAQIGAAVEVVKGIVQELTLLEVELGMSRRLLNPEHEERQRLELQVEELRRQLQRLVGDLETRAVGELDAGLEALGPPLVELPQVARQYARLALDLKIKEGMVSFLGTRLEETRYKEAQNTPTILVLDPAVPPEFRSAPRRTLIVLVAACTSLVVSVVLAFALEGLGQLSRGNREKIQEIRQLMRRDKQS